MAAIIILLIIIFIIVYLIVFSTKEKKAINEHEKYKQEVTNVYKNKNSE